VEKHDAVLYLRLALFLQILLVLIPCLFIYARASTCYLLVLPLGLGSLIVSVHFVHFKGVILTGLRENKLIYVFIFVNHGVSLNFASTFYGCQVTIKNMVQPYNVNK